MSAHDELAALVERHRPGTASGEGGITPMPDTWVFRDMDRSAARRAAVLILFGRLDDVPAHHPSSAVPADLDVLFVQRADTLRQHPGQIAFPGGAIDETDASTADAALREAVEETGLDPAGVQIIGSLPDAELPITNFLVTPVIGWWARPSDVFVVDPGESAKVFRVPVADLLDPANRVSAVIERGGLRHTSPAFTVDGETIWGFTGIVLSRLFDDLGWTQEWDAAAELVVPFG
ncbi:NUDIX hydrolase [Arthrobacter halodurans]|uniref:CoA pyrophosphatase n=1 Tax=Arthrobacter halodurans TaxID=516699 RepID=A0ABV4UMD5_9MICC